MESGASNPDPPDEAGGLIVMVRHDPADAARAIAFDLHAELAIGGAETELALTRLQARQLEHRDLAALAAAMRRAETVRDRTRALIAERVSSSLNTHVAIHPDTLRRAAAELMASEVAIAAAAARDRRSADRAKNARLFAALGAVLSGLVIGAGSTPLVGVGVTLVALVAVTASALRKRATATPTHDSLRGHCDLARTRWEQVAGSGADPRQINEIIHRYDPHDGVVGALLSENPAVRAVDRVAIERRMAWVSAWRTELGDETPITDPAIAELLKRGEAELWLTGGKGLRSTEPETLVVAAPYSDLPEARARDLHRRLLMLPRGNRVIVVLAPDPQAPSGARIPGLGWVPAIAGPAQVS